MIALQCSDELTVLHSQLSQGRSASCMQRLTYFTSLVHMACNVRCDRDCSCGACLAPAPTANPAVAPSGDIHMAITNCAVLTICAAARKWRRCNPNSCTRTDRVSATANAASEWLCDRGVSARCSFHLFAVCTARALCTGDHSNCPAEFPIYMLKHSANGENPGEVICCPGHATAQLSSARSTGQHRSWLCGDVVARVFCMMCDLRAISW